MRGAVGLTAIALSVAAAVAPEACAQATAPTPEVRITGFIDTITAWNKNFQDSLVSRTRDKEWYVRNRGRFDIVGQSLAAGGGGLPNGSSSSG